VHLCRSVALARRGRRSWAQSGHNVADNQDLYLSVTLDPG
jgi:hypothetical protein